MRLVRRARGLECSDAIVMAITMTGTSPTPCLVSALFCVGKTAVTGKLELEKVPQIEQDKFNNRTFCMGIMPQKP